MQGKAMGADGTRAIDTAIDFHRRLLPTELHIKLVVHDDDAMEGLRVAAQRILQAARQNRDPDVAEYLYRTYYCVCTAAAGYARLQALSLDHEIDAVKAVPDLCRDWCFLVDDDERAVPFPALTAFNSNGAFDRLLEQQGEKLVDQEGALRFLLARDSIDELQPDFDAAVQPDLLETVGSIMRAILVRLQPGSWLARPSDGASAGAVPTSTC